MLEIRQITRYEVPLYPRDGNFQTCPPSRIILQFGGITAAIAIVTQSCTCMGPPPPPRLIGEKDARSAITSLFAARQIELKTDQPITLRIDQPDSLVLSLDGYDPKTQVGYEYLASKDRDSIPDAYRSRLDSTRLESAPHILVIDAQYASYYDRGQKLVDIVEKFLDSLKAQGVI
ncbi:MAG: hypothetical protein IPH75_11830 [bacterium]|nr:hypothetical protein [bacterium]